MVGDRNKKKIVRTYMQFYQREKGAGKIAESAN